MKGSRKLYHAMVVVIMVSLIIAGCSNKNEASTSSTPTETETETKEATPQETAAPEKTETTTDQPVIKMSMSLQIGSNLEGVQTDPVAQEIEKQTGVQMDFVPMSEEQFKVLAASGDLPEIVLAQRSWLKVLIEGNHIIPLEDLVAKTTNIANQKERIEFSKKYLSNNTGQLYALAANAGPVAPQYLYGVGPNIRWDYYKELGFPEMKNSDDFLDVLKKMQDKHPETEDGKKVYGFSMWNDWGLWPYKLFSAYGNGIEQMGTMEYNSNYEAKNFLMDESSTWWDGIKFYNKAYRMGLLDPESFTQKFANMQAKGLNGQFLATYSDWATQLNAKLAEEGKDTSGFMPVPGMFPYVFHGGFSDNGNQDMLVVITKNNKNPERAMQLIDFVFSEAGSRLLWSGPEGVNWSVVDGTAKLKDEVVEAYDIGNFDYVNTTGITKYVKIAGYINAKVGADGQRMDLSISPEVFLKRSTALDKDYSSHYNAQYPGQVYDNLVANNELKFLDINTDFQIATGTVPDDITRIDTSLIDYIATNVPKAILAKTDAEYDSIRKELISKMVSMGLDKSNTYWKDVFTTTKAALQGN